MKKITDWFLNKTLTTKLLIVVLGFVVIIGGIITISNTLAAKAPKPSPTVEITNTPTPTPTDTPTNVPENNDPLGGGNPQPDDEGGHIVEIPANANYTADDLVRLSSFATEAALAYCAINMNETSDQRIARLAQWFAPESNAMRPNDLVPLVQKQECLSLGTLVGKPNAEDGTVRTKTTASVFSVYLIDADPNNTTAQQTYQTYDYTFAFRNGNWTVITND